MANFSWLHFSDLHLNTNEGFDTLYLRNALIECLRDNPDIPDYDYVFITGDIADKGDYSAICTWIDDFINSLKVDKNKIYWSVGNHDIRRDRSIRNNIIANIRTSSDSPLEFENAMRDNEKRNILTTLGMEEYVLHYESLFDRKLNKDEIKRGHHFYLLPANNSEPDFNLIICNTCLTSCDKYDPHNLLIVERDISNLSTKIVKSKPVIALGHHGREFFMDCELRRFSTLLQRLSVDIYLCGHAHQLGYQPYGDTSHTIHQFTSGGGINKASEYAFLYGKYDEASKSIFITPFYYAYDGNQKWNMDFTRHNKLTKDNPFVLDRLQQQVDLKSKRISLEENYQKTSNANLVLDAIQEFMQIVNDRTKKTLKVSLKEFLISKNIDFYDSEKIHELDRSLNGVVNKKEVRQDNRTQIKTSQDIETVNAIKNAFINDPKGLSRLLLATPFSSIAYSNLDGSLTHDFFMKNIYVESEASKTQLEKIVDNLFYSSANNITFIVGYSGCGKTTFINAALSEYLSSTEKDINVQLINCDNYSIHTDNSSLQSIFLNHLIRVIISNQEGLPAFLLFYNKNAIAINNVSTTIYHFVKYIENSISEKKITNNNLRPETHIELIDFCRRFDFRDILFLIFLLDLGFEYDSPTDSPIIFFIDNLDVINSSRELELFIKSFDDLILDMNRNLYDIVMAKDTQELHLSFTKKFRIFISMRETTRSTLPQSHFADIFNHIYNLIDITELYSKTDIIDKRLDLVKGFSYCDERIPVYLKHATKAMDCIINDSYSERVIVPLFNNNYRKFASLISNMTQNDHGLWTEYIYLFSNNTIGSRTGCRGLLINRILQAMSDNDNNYSFIALGVSNRLNTNNNYINISRVILSFLSNYTEATCSSVDQSIELSQLIKAFDGIFERDTLLNYIWNMYTLGRSSNWTHLITFNQISFEKNDCVLESYIDLLRLNPSRTFIHYTHAGKVFLENIISHFEYFSLRLFNAGSPLFVSTNIEIINDDGRYKFEKIINDVYSEVEKVCIITNRFNKKICQMHGYSDDDMEEIVRFIRSHYVPTIKHKDKTFKQTYEERLISSHIGYIDKYRLFLLNEVERVEEPEKRKINAILVGLIERYVNLFESNKVHKSNFSKQTLIPLFNSAICKIKNSDFIDISIQISSTP